MPRLRKWLDLSLQAKCLLLISFPAAATVLMAGASFVANSQTKTAAQQLNTALRIGTDIERLRTSENEASAQVRAYLITSDETFAGRTREALAKFDSTRQNLSDLTAGDPPQRQRLVQLAAIEQVRVARIFGEMSGVQYHAFPHDQLGAVLEAAEGDRTRLLHILTAIDSANTQHISAYLARVDELRARRNLVTAAGLLAGLAGGVMMTLLFAQGISRRVSRLQENIARLALGRELDPLPGRDEIGALNDSLGEVAGLLRQRRAALENTLDGIAEVDQAGRYSWINKAYSQMAGMSEVYRPPTLQATFPAETRSKIQEAIRMAQRSGRAEISARLEPPGGSPADVDVLFLRSGGPPDQGFHLFLHPAKQGRAQDQELIRAKDAAVASSRANTDFLAKISHDIRTPLNAILGAADLLSQTALTFDQSGYVHMFQRNCRRLVALINDFLDFSRIEAGAIQIERTPFRVREVAEDALATFREDAARKGIGLELDLDAQVPEWLTGDSLRIQQVLVNLLSNALKFTSQGRVAVRVHVAPHEDSDAPRLRYEISDTGPGIPLEDQAKIFGKFIQLPNQTSGQRGAGLGLAICRDLVELMGGVIGVSSQEGRGSVFHFTLPLEPAQPEALPLSETVSAGPDPGKLPGTSNSICLLVAEDTEDNRLLLEHYLRGELVELRFAFNGQEAMDMVQRGDRFDLILMDIDMPVLDGYGATRAIRAWEAQQGISTPIVALSADAMSHAVRRCLEAGCVAHVAKPIDRATLLETIQRYATDRGGTSLQPKASSSASVSEQILALVPQYLASKHQQIEEARSCLASRDFGPIRRFGHNLKGTGRGYGFPTIEDLGREIERAAVQADVDRIAKQLDALHRFICESGAETAEPVS
jgi:signal transduction histidine kinase/CheY-like chemotaxis protein